MSPGPVPDERIELDLDEHIEQYVKRTDAMARLTRVRTENRIAFILILTFVLTLPFYAFVLIFAPSVNPLLGPILDKWLTILASLAGAAVGVSGRSNGRSQGG